MPPKKETILVRQIALSRIEEIYDLAKQATVTENLRILFKIKYRILEEAFREFKESHFTILTQTTDTDIPAQENIRKEIEKKYFEICAIFESLFPPVLEAPLLQSRPTSNSSNVNLPKLELRKFSGDFLSWQPFKSLFDSLVHNQTQLSDIEKFQYLLLSLESEPLLLVRSIPVSPENYKLAYETLVKRYSNKRLLANSHWHTLKNYRPVNSENLKELRCLVDTFSENLAILKNLGFDIGAWDFIIVDLLMDKLPAAIRKRFELRGDSSEIPSYADLKDFLLRQCVALETIATTKVATSPSSSVKFSTSSFGKFRPVQQTKSLLVQSTTSSESSPQSVASKSRIKCPVCQNKHSIYCCPQYTSMAPRERHAAVKRVHLCFNCLKNSHGVTSCPSRLSCSHCDRRHHTSLHFTDDIVNHQPEVHSQTDAQPRTAISNSIESGAVHVGTSIAHTSVEKTVLLSTVMLEILDVNGDPQLVRALCDPGSMASFMTESCARKLKLPRSSSSVAIAGLGQMSTKSSLGVSRCFIRPSGSLQPLLPLDVIILHTVCSEMPFTTLSPSNLMCFKPFKLADPTWYQPGAIDVLLGADIYSSIVLPGLEQNINSSLVGIHTIFGVMLAGPAAYSKLPQPVHSFFIATDTPCSDSTLKKFWEIEEIPAKRCFSADDQRAEIHFVQTHFRTPEGRFGVSLPFASEEPIFKHTFSLAYRRLLALEHRFALNPVLKDEYANFMADYLASGHMTLLKEPSEGSNTYVIPHHCVFKMENNKPKIRVVFDASAKDANGISLNDSLLVGPKLQSDIATILLRFRIHPVVFTCDVRQMYRQILVAEDQRRFQLILWRFSPSDSVHTYQLNTVTYGVSSAPFLAIRTMRQLAEEGRSKFPLAAQAIQNNLYVDDLVCGADSVESALELQGQIIDLCNSGCFELRKWSSNHPTLLKNLPINHCLDQSLSFDKESKSTQKILGLQWQSLSDSFVFAVKPLSSPCTKRSMLSEIARIYDPLGFLCPVTFLAKRLIQLVWTLGLEWDEPPPREICEKWQQYKSQLDCLSSVQIPRGIIDSHVTSHELHAFCDASEHGYACVIYSRLIRQDGSVSISLLCAKSKVAPLKRLSIPRLELCAAVLLANLVIWVRTTFQEVFSFDRVYAWSDSTIVLTWIKSSPHRWKTFVSNRVSMIQDKLAPDCWYHVRSMENPADCASRGVLPKELISSPLWWAGPRWLSCSSSWPVKCSEVDPLPDADLEEKKSVLVAQICPSITDSIFNRFSCLRKIQGVIAYCLRFLHNCRNSDRVKGPLSQLELHKSLLLIVKIVQNQVFSQEISSLRRNDKCSKALQRLSPFVDSEGVLRVGGRISYADLPFETKHPALLPRTHILTELLITQIHRKHLHPGINTTIYLLQQNFWILGARRAVRSSLSKCYRCFRLKPTPLERPMGDLPSVRVSQAKPFSMVGVDYGGPIPITVSRTRGAKILKSYICLFVCLSTKAVHIEVVSDLSTDAFLAALRRFCARRGRCSHIYSDCGTNFVGANRQLRESLQLAAEGEAITWHFNPPSAPHFGGVWESGIKSFKTHLYRVIGSQVLTFEELTTLTTQIEALLNSRPLCSLSTDPKDLSCLTPGHFLTLEPLTAPPDPDLSHLKMSKLSRWQLIQSMQQGFWNRWSNEYLHQLYQRGKWFKSKYFENVDVGTLVLIKNELVPPLSWKLGRITKLHPGKDGICRVATVLTNQGTLQRPCVKLCPLPSQ